MKNFWQRPAEIPQRPQGDLLRRVKLGFVTREGDFLINYFLIFNYLIFSHVRIKGRIGDLWGGGQHG